MTKYKKTSLILLLIILNIIVLTTATFASVINTNDYLPGKLTGDEAKKTINISRKILGAIRNCGIIISVIIIAVIGLKYMLCSLEEKANYKENMTPYIIGCLLLMMATTIPSLIYNMLN